MEKQKYLGLVNLAGIHEFIGESRKLVELHYGSRMANEVVQRIVTELSQNSESVNDFMHELPKKLKDMLLIEEFIIPPVEIIDGDDYNYPNQLLFVFKNQPDTVKIEQMLRDIVREYFVKKGERSLEHLEDFKEYSAAWLSQWQDSLPIFFTSVKMKENDFPKHHQTLQKKLIAHKLNRRFDQWQAGEPVSKCIQCGHREVAGPIQSEKDNKHFWDNNVSSLIAQGKLKKNERICPVCLGKRILAMTDPEREKIPTTTFMAALPFFEKLTEIMRDNKDKKKEEKWSIFYNKIKEINQCLNYNFSDKFREIKTFSDLTKLENKSNAEWFYEDFYSSKDFKDIVKPEYKEKIEDLLNEGKKALNEYLKIIDKKPSKFIALIEFDGDEMGKKRGKLNQKDLEKLSKEISAFSKDVNTKIFSNSKRFLIYSGGEDVLGFASMAEALDLINEINNEFLANINNITPQKFTGSGSVTFFPHDFPLQEALNISDKNIHIAKDDFERDSLVIGWILPDSSQFVFGSKWNVPTNGNPDFKIYDLLSESIEWFWKGKKIDDIDERIIFTVSRRFLYDVLDIIKLFYEEDSGNLLTPTKDAFEGELVRLMMRHINVDKPENVPFKQQDKNKYLKDACNVYVSKVKQVILEKYRLSDTIFGLTNMEAFFKLIDFYVSRVEGRR